MKRLLLLSNSTTPNGGYLGHAMETITDFLGAGVTEVLLVPYAAVTESYDEYTSRTRQRFLASGYQLTSIHECPKPIQAVGNAQAIAIGGGNSFHLLRCLYEANILQGIRERVNFGMPYIGWSAGANVACPTIKTTNDMPVVWPPNPEALHLVPFQINPHYVDANPPEFRGETRAQRINEFTYLNPNVYVIGLPEGAMIRIEGSTVQLLGSETAMVFSSDVEPAAYHSLEFLQGLLR
ncbi:MAG: dipeptidase PepE [Gammaproteobacteria bacterium]